MARRSAARPDTIRRHNLHILLAELHHHGPLSRAELTQNLGLNRSTIGALVSDLTDTRLVIEHAPGTRASGAGRPSHVVGPRPDGPYALAVDIDVRRLDVAAVALGGTVLSRHAVDLPLNPHPDDAVAAVLAGARTAACEVPPGSWLAGVGVAVAGTVRSRDGLVLGAPNLHWHDVDLIQGLRAGLCSDVPIRIGNDANLAVLAEHVRGAARDVDNAVYVLARAGVGAGILADGAALLGANGLGGEIGHVIVDPSGPACYCGNRGCLESMMGERALYRRAGMGDSADPDATAMVVRAAAEGNERAMLAIGQVSDWLAVGLAGLANILNPQLIVIGGSISTLVQARLGQIQGALDELMSAAPGESAQIRVSPLGRDAVLLGAAEIGFSDLIESPVETALAHGPLVSTG